MNRWKLSTLALAGMLAGSLSLGAMSSAAADPQPRMRGALDALYAAESHLQAASHDKGGHRAKAARLTRQAIAEVKAGIRFDNRR